MQTSLEMLAGKGFTLSRPRAVPSRTSPPQLGQKVLLAGGLRSLRDQTESEEPRETSIRSRVNRLFFITSPFPYLYSRKASYAQLNSSIYVSDRRILNIITFPIIPQKMAKASAVGTLILRHWAAAILSTAQITLTYS
jgi:hypothetical protein